MLFFKIKENPKINLFKKQKKNKKISTKLLKSSYCSIRMLVKQALPKIKEVRYED